VGRIGRYAMIRAYPRHRQRHVLGKRVECRGRLRARSVRQVTTARVVVVAAAGRCSRCGGEIQRRVRRQDSRQRRRRLACLGRSRSIALRRWLWQGGCAGVWSGAGVSYLWSAGQYLRLPDATFEGIGRRDGMPLDGTRREGN
jgi:hypothetical protein